MTTWLEATRHGEGYGDREGLPLASLRLYSGALYPADVQLLVEMAGDQLHDEGAEPARLDLYVLVAYREPVLIASTTTPTRSQP